MVKAAILSTVPMPVSKKPTGNEKNSGGNRMPISKPEDVIEVATQTFNSGDVDTHMANYEPDAYLNFEPGHLTATGIPAIREAFTGILAMKPTLTLELLSCNQTGDIALIRDRWHLTGTGGDGNPVDMSGQTAAVLRRQSDGNWLIVIDDIFSPD
jgi:ketosteroid isomerase-like protein